MSSSTVTNNMIQTQGLSSSPSMRIEEETMMMLMMQNKKQQGIVTILGDASTNTASASSLRRTLSADMSTKTWLPHHQNNDSNPIKKIASSEELLKHQNSKPIPNSSSSSSSSEGEEEEYYEDAEAAAESERLEIWSSIQRNKKEEQEKSGPLDTWGTIMSLKGNNNNPLEISKSLPVSVTPYVHPLVKRSKSALSEKSLEICTESLGSETGSDGLFSSSYPSSESGESELDKYKEQQQQQEQEQEEEVKEVEVVKEQAHVSIAATTKSKSPPRCFPPPLPSLSFQANNTNNSKGGPSLHMRPHRDNGRLVLEAVSLPSQNNFSACRQDGRLVLTFANEEVEEENYYHEEEEGVDELGEEFEGFEGEEKEDDEDEYEGEYDDDETEEEEEVEESEGVESTVIEKAPFVSSEISTTSGSVHRLALMMNKTIGLVNTNYRNTNWSEKFNKGVDLEDVTSVVEMEPSSASAMAKSLSPRPRVARLIPSTASAEASFNFNAYEYYWRTKPTEQNNNNYNFNLPLPHKNNNSSKAIVSGGDINQTSNEQQQLLVLRGKNGDYLVHNLKSCKDSRRSFLFWEPYCIATS